MIRKLEEKDIDIIMNIWLDTNIKAHYFVSRKYWEDNYDMVKEVLPKAEVYVYEDDNNEIDGFIGISDNHIEGIFVRENLQSKGIGKSLLNHVKNIKDNLTLNVYQKNVRAKNFYLREGFVIQYEEIDEDTDEKEYIMVRR